MSRQPPPKFFLLTKGGFSISQRSDKAQLSALICVDSRPTSVEKIASGIIFSRSVHWQSDVTLSLTQSPVLTPAHPPIYLLVRTSAHPPARTSAHPLARPPARSLRGAALRWQPREILNIASHTAREEVFFSPAENSDREFCQLNRKQAASWRANSVQLTFRP